MVASPLVFSPVTSSPAMTPNTPASPNSVLRAASNDQPARCSETGVLPMPRSTTPYEVRMNSQ